MDSMNPVGLYHDSSLDGLVMPQNGRSRRSNSNHKRAESQSWGALPDENVNNSRVQPPNATEAALRPPITYRGAPANPDPSLHRSFSQRAKGRPFAKEAFAEDEDYLADNRNGVVQGQAVKSPPVDNHTDRSVHDSITIPADQPIRNGHTRVQSQQAEIPRDSGTRIRSEGRSSKGSVRAQQPSQRQQGPTDNEVFSPPSAEVATPVSQTQRRTSSKREVQPQVAEPDLTINRSATLRDAANQTDEQKNGWAADRSPLQKLEVKLTDISKEEKRARVQEAEMKLMREKSGKAPVRSPRESSTTNTITPQRVRSEAQRTTSTAVAGPRTPDARISRSQSGSAAQTQIPRADPPAGSRRVISSGANNTTRASDSQLPATGSTTRQPQTPSTSAPTVLTGSPNDARASRGTARSASARQPQAARPVNEAVSASRSVSSQQPKPKSRSREEEMPMTEAEREASREATLDQLTGDGISVGRASSRRIQKVPPPAITYVQKPRSNAPDTGPIAVDLSTLSGGDNLVGSTSQKAAKQIDNTYPPSYQKEPQPAGLGLQHPRALRSVDSPPVSLVDASKQRNRKSSVSFKEPFDRRRPVDEWQNAKTASLTSEDFSTESVSGPATATATDTADLNKAWWEQDKTKAKTRTRPSTTQNQPAEPVEDRTAQFSPRLWLKCGPLLRYAGLRRTGNKLNSTPEDKEFWRGTVMIVTQDSQCSYEDVPTLRLFSQPRKILPPPPAFVAGDQLAPEYVDPIAGLTKLSRTGRARYVRPIDHLDQERDLSRIEDDNGIYEAAPSPLDDHGSKDATAAVINRRLLDQDGERLGRFKEVKGVRIYADPDRDVTFWRFNLEIELGAQQQHVAYRINKSASTGFWVPARGQTMNMMFHTCNGFSMSVNSDTFSGPDPMWRDVLNNHQTRPFHVMIGGGDQIYNDRVMVETKHFGEWISIKNPTHKHQAPFTNEMKEELESFYLERYSMWFSQGLFGMANASIPMINIWDDHDIIDGFGSYPHEFMKSPVFTGIGNIAFKYYMLFQHQSVESMTEKEDPSWVLGHAPGPYIHQKSRSVYVELGQSVAFLGLDCRTERTRNDVLSIDTLELVLDRCRREMIEGRTKHLILLLGVPIAYPRLVWLENILTSKAMDPIKALGRMNVLKSNFLNKFDGGVEILDDLDDHWTASHHKDERNILIQELQDLAAEKSARVTILGGDVHLAAIGQFYSNPKLKIPKDKDHRYMPNIVSSAIVNTPPPDVMADIINKRNKTHHMDKYTDENMIPMFTHDVDQKRRNNTHLLPRRNWCSIRQYSPGDTPPTSPSLSPSVLEDGHSEQLADHDSQLEAPKRRMSFTKADFNPRGLMRRLSSRNAPPTSFRGSTDPDNPRAASFDNARPNMDRTGSYGQSSSSQHRASSVDRGLDIPSLRPTFHRRPTNFSEKAARKGNVFAIDSEGNEFDVNDHINLEGGLDISLNCEINQKDPAGFTTPYRILVPALWYDGSSDREKLGGAVKPGRRASILKKFGLGASRPRNVADNQGAGNWGQSMSDTESMSADEGTRPQKPRRSFSLFGSKRRKQEKMFDDTGYDQDLMNRQPHQPQQQFTGPSAYDAHTTSQTMPVSQQPAPQQLYNTMPRSEHTTNAPPQGSVPMQQISMPNNVPVRQSSVQNSAPVQNPVPARQSSVQTSQVSRQNTHQSFVQQPSQRKSRPMSYTIGGPVGGHTPEPFYDADSMYVSHQQQQDRSQRPPSENSHQVQPVPGIGSVADNYQQPQQTQLRGNGIIGNDLRPNSRDNTNRGYSGIEAYKEPKSPRRWSLSIKDKARGLLGGRDSGKRNDYYSDSEEEDFWEGDQNANTHTNRY